MILNFLRISLLIILIIVVMVDVPVPEVLTAQVNQLVIAFAIIVIIIAIDEIIGFLCGLIFLIIYFKYYQKKVNSTTTSNQELQEPLIKAYNPFNMNNYSNINGTIDEFTSDTKPVQNAKTEQVGNHYTSLNDKTNTLIMPYISTELLDKAQNNIYDNNNYYLEIKKMDNAYGIQGLNSDKIHYEAYDKNLINNNFSN